MTQFLSQPPEYYAADLLTEYWGTVQPSVGGLTPVWELDSGTLASVEFPISTNWPSGDTYPIITLTNRTGNVVSGGGTNYTSKQGDGSGNNQERLEDFLLTAHTDSEETYGSGDTPAEVYAWRLLGHAFRIIERHGESYSSDLYGIYMTAPDGSIPDQSSTEVTHQEQSTVTVHWNKTPP